MFWLKIVLTRQFRFDAFDYNEKKNSDNKPRISLLN